jgi:hypothetical protein
VPPAAPGLGSLCEATPTLADRAHPAESCGRTGQKHCEPEYGIPQSASHRLNASQAHKCKADRGRSEDSTRPGKIHVDDIHQAPPAHPPPRAYALTRQSARSTLVCPPRPSPTSWSFARDTTGSSALRQFLPRSLSLAGSWLIGARTFPSVFVSVSEKETHHETHVDQRHAG